MLEQCEKLDKNVVAEKHCCVKDMSRIESNTVTINGVEIRSRIIDVTRERDGVKIPFIIRQIFCHPGAPIDMLRRHITFKEGLFGKEYELLT